jgi:hypothetical protein
MNNWKTAITRSSPSKPMKILASTLDFKSCLDYGCGRGFDAQYFGLAKYDPHWHPILPEGKFKNVVCNYVLNVIASQDERLNVLRKIQGLLTDDGEAFISVRRDLKTDSNTQFIVELPLEIIHEDSGVCIYKLNKETNV